MNLCVAEELTTVQREMVNDNVLGFCCCQQALQGNRRDLPLVAATCSIFRSSRTTVTLLPAVPVCSKLMWLLIEIRYGRGESVAKTTQVGSVFLG